MERVEKKLQLTDEAFKRHIGTTKKVFHLMLDILKMAHDMLHEQGGQPLKNLSIGDKLLITLQYYREYRTQENIGADFGCSKSTVCRSIHWVEDTLSADGRFQLPGKKALQEEENIKTVAVDVMEHPMERPKENQEEWYSGKKNDIRSSPRSSERGKRV